MLGMVGDTMANADLPFNDRNASSSTAIQSRKQIYTPMNEREIRVLTIVPGAKSQAVEVHLEVISSTKAVQYEALSYVWGSVRADHKIICNNVSVEVTESLHTALVHLRYPKTWRRLWADQLCIDQTNEDEVMAQVRNMGNIYAHASRVIVWLGKRDKKMARAWRVVQETCLSVSLVRSDFLDMSPIRPTGDQRSSSATNSTGRGHGSPKPKRKIGSHSSSRSEALSSRNSSSSMNRPFRDTLNRSNSSLSSSISSLSSNSSLSSHSSPRTPIRKSTKSFFVHQSHIDANNTPSRKSSSAPNSPALQPSKLKLALAIFQHEYFDRRWTFQEIVLSPAAILVSDEIEFALADLIGWYFHYVTKPTFTPDFTSHSGKMKANGESMVYDSVRGFENVIHIRHELAKAEETGANGLGPFRREGIKFSTLLMLTRQLKTYKAEDRILSLLGLHQGFANYLSEVNDEEGWLPVPELFLTASRYCIEIEGDLDILSAAGTYSGNMEKGYESWPSWLPDWRRDYPIRPFVLENLKSSTENNRVQDEFYPDKGCQLYCASSKLKMTCAVGEDDDGRFIFNVQGSRLGVVVMRPGSWPSHYFVPAHQVQEFLMHEGSGPDKHEQLLSNLASAPHQDSGFEDYAKSIITSAMTHNDVCRPLQTHAAIKDGDWVCMLFGGQMLYILRPYPDCQDKIRGSVNSELSSSPGGKYEQLQSRVHNPTAQCRFVGECVVPGLMNGCFATKSLGQDHATETIKFKLV